MCGAEKKQGPRVMCLGMIGWNCKGPVHIWEPEAKEEKAEIAERTKRLNEGWAAEQKRLNDESKKSEEWQQLRELELKAAREAKAAAKLRGEKCEKTTQRNLKSLT